MKPGMIKPKTARFVVGAAGVAITAAMGGLLAASGKLDWRAAMMAGGAALIAWVQRQPWQDVLQELLDTLPEETAAVVRESVRPSEPPADGQQQS